MIDHYADWTDADARIEREYDEAAMREKTINESEEILRDLGWSLDFEADVTGEGDQMWMLRLTDPWGEEHREDVYSRDDVPSILLRWEEVAINAALTT